MINAPLVARALAILGVAFIILGVVAGIIVYDTDVAEDYKRAKDTFEELWDNEFAEQSYIVQKELQNSNIMITAITVISGVVSGLFFLGLGSLLEVAIDIRNKLNKPEKELDQSA